MSLQCVRVHMHMHKHTVLKATRVRGSRGVVPAVILVLIVINDK